MLNVIFRVIVVLCIVTRWIYWKKEERIADREKPKLQRTRFSYISQGVWLLISYFPLAQVLGFPLFSFHAVGAQIIGTILVVSGTGICLWARKILGSNWANGYEYQVKEKQELITTNIYGIIRHPIYLGLALTLIGAELVAQSYLWISYLGLFFVFYVQGKREEKNFLNYFGNEYKEYMKRTKMLIPYVL